MCLFTLMKSCGVQSLHCVVCDQLWLMTCIREEEEDWVVCLVINATLIGFILIMFVVNYYFLFLCQASLPIMFSTCVSVHPFICLLPKLWTWHFERKSTDFDANWCKWSTGQGQKTVSLGGERSRSHKAKGRFECLTEASFWVE